MAGHTENSYGYYSKLDLRSPERVVGDVIFTDENPIVPVKAVLTDYFKTLHEEESLRLANRDLQLITKRYDQRKHREEENEKRKEIIATKVKTKLDTLLRFKKGKVRIMQMGGSHIQAEIWPDQVRKDLLELGDSINGGRGFFFPFRLAKTWNPKNFQIQVMPVLT